MWIVQEILCANRKVLLHCGDNFIVPFASLYSFSRAGEGEVHTKTVPVLGGLDGYAESMLHGA